MLLLSSSSSSFYEKFSCHIFEDYIDANQKIRFKLKFNVTEEYFLFLCVIFLLFFSQNFAHSIIPKNKKDAKSNTIIPALSFVEVVGISKVGVVIATVALPQIPQVLLQLFLTLKFVSQNMYTLTHSSNPSSHSIEILVSDS